MPSVYVVKYKNPILNTKEILGIYKDEVEANEAVDNWISEEVDDGVYLTQGIQNYWIRTDTLDSIVQFLIDRDILGKCFKEGFEMEYREDRDYANCLQDILNQLPLNITDQIYREYLKYPDILTYGIEDPNQGKVWGIVDTGTGEISTLYSNYERAQEKLQAYIAKSMQGSSSNLIKPMQSDPMLTKQIAWHLQKAGILGPNFQLPSGPDLEYLQCLQTLLREHQIHEFYPNPPKLVEYPLQ